MNKKNLLKISKLFLKFNLNLQNIEYIFLIIKTFFDWLRNF